MRNKDAMGLPVPVMNRPGEPNFKNYMMFSPTVPSTGVRFMFGFTKPYTPVPPPEPPTGGGSPNVVPYSRFKEKQDQRAAQRLSGYTPNVIPFRKVV